MSNEIKKLDVYVTQLIDELTSIFLLENEVQLHAEELNDEDEVGPSDWKTSDHEASHSERAMNLSEGEEGEQLEELKGMGKQM